MFLSPGLGGRWFYQCCTRSRGAGHLARLPKPGSVNTGVFRGHFGSSSCLGSSAAFASSTHHAGQHGKARLPGGTRENCCRSGARAFACSYDGQWRRCQHSRAAAASTPSRPGAASAQRRSPRQGQQDNSDTDGFWGSVKEASTEVLRTQNAVWMSGVGSKVLVVLSLGHLGIPQRTDTYCDGRPQHQRRLLDAARPLASPGTSSTATPAACRSVSVAREAANEERIRAWDEHSPTARVGCRAFFVVGQCYKNSTAIRGATWSC